MGAPRCAVTLAMSQAKRYRKKGKRAPVLRGSVRGNQRAAPALPRSLSGIAVIVSLARGKLHKRRCYIPWNEK